MSELQSSVLLSSSSSLAAAKQLSDNQKTWERRLDEAKRKHRPKLKDWAKDGFHDAGPRGTAFLQLKRETLDGFVNHVQRPRPSSPSSSAGQLQPLFKIDKISCANMTVTEFITSYEQPGIPCVITDVPKRQNWPAVSRWTLEQLSRECFDRPRTIPEVKGDLMPPSSSIGERYFKVGEDDDGYKVKVRLRYFLRYLQNNKDDSPLYMFDSNYDDDPVAKSLLADYQVPPYFPEDFFALLGEKRRPPYRWFLLGPQRSGTCVHIDPLGTSAWNTVVTGRKRWVLLPPGVKKSVAKGSDVLRKGEDDESVNYFADLLPRLRSQHPEIPIIEFVQGPGDTVFVPGGWWHGVLNLDDTVAITQNYCSRANFEEVWRKTRSGRKKMAVKWLKALRAEYPDLAEMASDLNARDDFQMMSMSASTEDTKGRSDGRKKKGKKRKEEGGDAAEGSSKRKKKRGDEEAKVGVEAVPSAQ